MRVEQKKVHIYLLGAKKKKKLTSDEPQGTK